MVGIDSPSFALEGLATTDTHPWRTTIREAPTQGGVVGTLSGSRLPTEPVRELLFIDGCESLNLRGAVHEWYTNGGS